MSERTVEEQLITYLQDAHALERHVEKALTALIATTGAPELREPLEAHRTVTRRHITAVADRLRAHRARPSAGKDSGMALAALAAGLLFRARADHGGKHARDAYALIHLAVAGYEMLGHLARRLRDEDTTAMAARHLAEERETARVIDTKWDLLLDLSLKQSGVNSAPPAVQPRSFIDKPTG